MATKLAKSMVTRFGMSKLLGPLAYGENEGEVFLGRSITRQQHVSEDTQKKVDSEIKKVIDQGYARAKKILQDKIADLHTLAKALLNYETLTGDEIKNLILHNKQPDKMDQKDQQEKEDCAEVFGPTRFYGKLTLNNLVAPLPK